MDSPAQSGVKKNLEILSIQFLDKAKIRHYVSRQQHMLRNEDPKFKTVDCNKLALNELVDQYMKIYNKWHRNESNVATDFILVKKRDETDYLQVTYNRVQEQKNRELEKEKIDPTVGNNSTFILFFFLKENDQLKNIVAATSGTAWQAVRGCCDPTYPIKIIEQVGSTNKNIVRIKKRALFGNSTTEISHSVPLNELYNTSSLYHLVENITFEIDKERGSTLLNIIEKHSTPCDPTVEELTENVEALSIGKVNKKETQRVLMEITTGGNVRFGRKVRSIESYCEIIMCLNEFALKEQKDKRFNFLYFSEVDGQNKSELDDTLIKGIFGRFHKKQNQIVNLRHAHFEEFLLADKFDIKIKGKYRYEYLGSELPDMGKILAWIEMKQQTEQVTCATSRRKVSTSVAKHKQFREIMKEGMLRATKQSSNMKLKANLIDYIEREIVHKGVHYFKLRMKWYRLDVDYLSLVQQDFEGVKKMAFIGQNDKGNLPIAWKKKTSFSVKDLKKILNATDTNRMTIFDQKLKALRVSYISKNNNHNNEYFVVQKKLVGEILNMKEIRDYRNSIESTLKRFPDSSIHCSKETWNAFLQEEHRKTDSSSHNIPENHLMIIWQQLNKSRKVFTNNYVINPMFDHLEDDLKELELKDEEYKKLKKYLKFCAEDQDEGEYNLCYLNEDFIGRMENHNYLVFDKICPDNIEPCDIFDYTEDTIYLYHVKADFGHQTRDVCSQILNSAVLIQAALKTNQEDNFLKKLWNKANENLTDEENQKWRSKLHEKLRSDPFGEENFMNLFYTKDIVFVYAYLAPKLDKTPDDLHTIPDDIYNLCRNLGFLNESGNCTERFPIEKMKFTEELVKNESISKNECNKAHKIMSDRKKVLDIVNSSCKELGFTDKCGSLTTKFFNTTQGNFVEEIRGKFTQKIYTIQNCKDAYNELKNRNFSNSNLAKMEVIRLADKFNTFTKQFRFKMCEIPRKKYNQLAPSSP